METTKKKKKNERKDFLRQLVWYLWLESHHVLGNNLQEYQDLTRVLVQSKKTLRLA